MANASVLGFTGAFSDSVTTAYPLGNGYRWYLPALMRFNAPDSFSPFGAGGINPYVYCADDPVNRCDPSGHMLQQDVEETPTESSAASVIQQFNEEFNRIERIKKKDQRLKGYIRMMRKYGMEKRINRYDKGNLFFNAGLVSWEQVESGIMQPLLNKTPSFSRIVRDADFAIASMLQAMRLYPADADKEIARGLMNEYRAAINEIANRFTAEIPEIHSALPADQLPAHAVLQVYEEKTVTTNPSHNVFYSKDIFEAEVQIPPLMPEVVIEVRPSSSTMAQNNPERIGLE